MADKSSVSWIMTLLTFIVGLTSTVAAVCITIPLWWVPPGTSIRPMFLVFVQVIISLATAVMGMGLGVFALYFAWGRVHLIGLAILAILYCYTPLLVAHAVASWIISVHHLILEG